MRSLLAEGGELLTCVFPIGPREGGPPFAMSVDLVRSLLEPAGFEAASVHDDLPLEEQHRRPADPLESVRGRGTALVSWRVPNAMGRESVAGTAAASLALQSDYRVAVLGAGVAGAVCASRLASLPGITTTVFDMGSRGPGGRACSRPVDGKGGSFSPADQGGATSLDALPEGAGALTFDHGVQAFTVLDADVRTLVDGWVREGYVSAWEGRFGVVDAATGRFAPLGTESAADADDPFGLLEPARGPRYVGVPSMAHLVRGMLERAALAAAECGGSLTERRGCKATGVTHATEGHSEEARGARWLVEASDGVHQHFDAVVVAGHSAAVAADVAARVPASLRNDAGGGAGGGAGDDTPSSPLLDAMRAVSYPHGTSPLYTLLVAFAEPLGERAPFDGAALANSAELRWISRDSSKPGRARDDGVELWVALSTE